MENVNVSNICLKTGRLVIRELKYGDLDDFYECCSNMEVARLAGWDYHKNIQISKYILDEFIADKNVFGIVDSKNDKLIGNVSITTCKNNYEIGYCLLPFYWGKGLMAEALDSILVYLFNNYKVDTIKCCCFKENKRSARVLEKCGFIFKSTNYIDELNKEIKIYIKKRF